MAKKFGDGISWNNFALEILDETKEDRNKIFFKYEDKKETIQHIEKYLPTNKSSINKLFIYRALDVGCNIGRWAHLLNERGFYYTGVDQSRSAINIASQLFPEGIFYNQFLWDITFNQEFNLVFCNNVLQHNTLPEKHKILPKIYDSLKPDGILFINESTTTNETKTQLTYKGWIELINNYNFEFLESWQPNKIGLNECYLFRKITI